MAAYQVLCWQEIPSVVEARDETGVKKKMLSDKFQVLIDVAAMQRKLAGTDSYLDQWNKTKPENKPGSAIEVLAEVSAEIEGRYPQIREAVLADR